METYLTCGFLCDTTDNPLDPLHPDLQLHVGGGGDDDHSSLCGGDGGCLPVSLHSSITEHTVPTPSLPPHISLASA